jgi:hypothetical protein
MFILVIELNDFKNSLYQSLFDGHFLFLLQGNLLVYFNFHCSYMMIILNQQFSVHGSMIKKFTTSLCIKICYDPQEKVFKFHKFLEHVQKAFEMRPNLC